MLRPATVADVPEAYVVVREGFASYRSFGLPGWEPPDEPMHEMEARLASGWGAVVEEGGEIVGFGAFEQAREGPREGPELPGLAHVWAIFVRETHWGAGVATALLEAVTAEIARRGYAEARLFTPALQARARRFYAREGWTERGEPFAVEPLGLDMVELRRPVA
jgi:GNAT superfamily N-acetyltransferase